VKTGAAKAKRVNAEEPALLAFDAISSAWRRLGPRAKSF
jgi:hypothetical protein